MLWIVDDPEAAIERAVEAGAVRGAPRGGRARMAPGSYPGPLRPPLGDREARRGLAAGGGTATWRSATVTVEALLIGGERVLAAEGRTFDTVNPANGEVFRTVAEAGAEDADRAVRAATRAFDDWGTRTPIQRAKVLYRWADLIEEHADELALIETRDMGMAIGDARWCAGNAAAVMRYYAGAVDKFFGSTIPVDRDGIVLTFREPIGVAALITPWNFPLNIGNWKTAPALAAGNTVVLKPASLSPLSVLRYAELGLEAGLPAGALNVVPGPGRGRRRARRAPAGRQGGLHRVDRGRDRDRAQGRRDDQARHARARRQERLHRLRRRRPREGGPDGSLRRVRERRAGLLRALAPARRGLREGRAARALHRGDARDRGRRPGVGRHADGAARFGRSARDCGGLHRARRRRGRDRARGWGPARGLSTAASTSAPRSWTGARTTWSSPARRSSGPWCP